MSQNLQNISRNVGFSKWIFENFASGNRLCSRKNGFASGSKHLENIEKDQVNDAENLIIHDRLILHPFSPKAVNNFNSSPPFGLCDIFNYLIYQSIAYIAAAMFIHPPSRPPLHLHLA